MNKTMKKIIDTFATESPEKKAFIDEMVHGTFVKEGRMVAFPTCFPGASVPIVHDESRITALDITCDHILYGGTSGKRAHVFRAWFWGVTGAVFDMGVFEGKENCSAICCGEEQLIACLNGPDGGSLYACDLVPLPFDLIQEWGFRRKPFVELPPIGHRENILHAVTSRDRTKIVGISENHLFTVDFESLTPCIVSDIPGKGRISCGPNGEIFGLDDGDTLWIFNPNDRSLKRKAIQLPQGNWDGSYVRWAFDPQGNRLYIADADGKVFAIASDGRLSDLLCKTPFFPVGTMSVTFDGRLFGICGEGIGRLFCYRPRHGTVSDLGVPVSVLQSRRYGYVFGDSLTGRDGEIVFGENDNSGHVWMYFPKIEA